MPINTDHTTIPREMAIEDMLGRTPGWLLRSGLGMLGLFLVVVLGITALIRYPERVEAPFVLQSKTVPLAVHAGATNYIEAMLVGNNHPVVVGDTLLVLRGDGGWRTLTNLYGYLNADAWDAGELPPDLAYPSGVRQEVARLTSLLKAWQSYLVTNGTADAVAAYEREHAEAGNLSTSLQKQIDLYDRELAMKNRHLDRTRQLVRDSIISTQEAEAVEEQYITARRQREAMVAGDAQNRLRMNQLDQEVLRLRLTHRERLAEFDRQLRQQADVVRAAADQFSLQHFVLAAEGGTMHWRPEVREGALVSGAEPLGYITSNETNQSLVARVTLPPEGAGRAEIGN